MYGNRLAPIAIILLSLIWLREPYIETDIVRWVSHGKLTLYSTAIARQDNNFSGNFTNPRTIVNIACILQERLKIELPAPRIESIIKRLVFEMSFPGIL